MDDQLKKLLEVDLSSEQFVRHVLGRLESITRRVALIALAEWDCLALVDQKLFDAIVPLGRPAWGAWSELIAMLLKAVNRNLATASPELRERLQQSALYQDIRSLWDRELPQEAKVLLAAFAPYTSKQDVRKITFSIAVKRLTEVRNRIAHDSIMRDDYWQALARICRPLVVHLNSIEPQRWMDAGVDASGPWLYRRDAHVFEYNGLDKKLNANYIDNAGNRESSEALGAEIVSALERMLGRSARQATNITWLLSELGPEDDRGIVLDDFLVQDVAGAGGFSIVYKARQLSTGLRVAIKVLRDGLDEETVERFKREARYLGRVQHQNVLHVIASGEAHWANPPKFLEPAGDWYQKDFKSSARLKHYLVTEWVDGETLDEVFRKPSARTVSEMALLFEQAAIGLSVIHAQGLVHRDIKPSNIMVSPDETLKLMDFGVAMATREGATRYTVAGMAAGTPAYMSPEQVRAMELESEVGPQSDVYSLCATFYEIFTHSRIFDHDNTSVIAVSAAKRKGERPVPAKNLVRHLSPELDSILMGGLEPEIRDRYPSADALLADIRHYLKDEPIEHKPPSLLRRLQLAYRRNRGIANLSGAFSVVAIVSSLFYVDQIRDERDRTQERYADLLVERARQELAEQRREQASVYLVEALKQGRDDAPLRVLLGTAMSSVDALLFSVGGATEPVGRPILFSPARTNLATVSGESEIVLWSLADGQQLSRIPALPECRDIAGGPGAVFSPEGGFLLAWCGIRARLYMGDGTREVCTLAGHGLDITTARFSSDERLLATGGVDDVVRLWSVPGCQLRRTLHGHEATVNNVGFSDDDALLLSASNDGTVRLWEVASGEPVRTFRTANGSPVGKASFSQRGQLVVGAPTYGAHGPELIVWDASTGALTASFPVIPGSILEFGISNERSTVLLHSSEHNAAVLIDIDSGEVLCSVAADNISAAAYSPAGDRIAIGTLDQRVMIVATEDCSEVKTFASQTGSWPVSEIAFSPDGDLVAASDGNGIVKVWEVLEDPALIATAPQMANAVLIVEPPGSTEILAVLSQGQILKVSATGLKILASLDIAEPIVAAEADSSVTKIAYLTKDRSLGLWNLEEERLAWRNVLDVPTEPVGQTLRRPSGLDPQTSLVTGSNVIAMPAGGVPNRGPLRFSGTGDAVLFVTGQGAIQGFDVRSGSRIGELSAPPADLEVHDVFCPQGLDRCKAAGQSALPGSGVTMLLYDFAAKAVVREFRGHQGPFITDAMFSPDGSLVATAGADKTVRLFETQTGKQQTAFLGYGNFVDAIPVALNIARNNALVLTGTADGMARVWDARTGALLYMFEAGYGGVGLRFDVGGRLITQRSEIKLSAWRLPYETRSAVELERLLPTKVPWRLRDGKLDDIGNPRTAARSQ